MTRGGTNWVDDALWRRRLAGGFAMWGGKKIAGGTPAPRNPSSFVESLGYVFLIRIVVGNTGILANV